MRATTQGRASQQQTTGQMGRPQAAGAGGSTKRSSPKVGHGQRGRAVALGPQPLQQLLAGHLCGGRGEGRACGSALGSGCS